MALAKFEYPATLYYRKYKSLLSTSWLVHRHLEHVKIRLTVLRIDAWKDLLNNGYISISPQISPRHQTRF